MTANAAVFSVDRHVADGRGEQTALLTHGTRWSYADLLDHVERAGFMLCSAGVRPLDRVAMVARDTPEAAAILLAAMRAGAVPAPLHTRLSEAEYALVMQDARPRAAVVDAEHVESMRRIRAQTGWPEILIALGDAPAGSDDVLAAAPGMAEGGRCGPAPTGPDDVALLQYTSGSTGRSKGVAHLHRGLLALPAGFGRRLALRPDDICFSAAKLPFGYGLGNSLLLPLAAGASTLLRAEPSEPVGVLEAIEQTRPTVFFGGPALYAAMLAVAAAGASFDTSSVRLFVSAGEPLSASLFEQWQRAFGRPILDGIGSTECLHVFISGEPGDLRPGCLGTVVPPYEVRLLDDAGAPARPGEAGHLRVAGPAITSRYWNRPPGGATRDAAVDGWVHTGDLLTQAEDGTFAYVGRSDDVFKVRGMKIAPLEIEACLNAHPAVAESAVVSASDRNGLTIACALVRPQRDWEPTSELARTLRAHARATLSPHKVPRIVRFTEDLPRNGTGKLSRRLLREQAAALVNAPEGAEA